MILACQNIEKSFDGELLLQDVNFHIEEREKACPYRDQRSWKIYPFKDHHGRNPCGMAAR